MTGADSTCRPTWFHAFLFACGRFAGTLSPGPMTTERDGSAAAIRIVPGDTITADFARYRDEDPAYCPSAHMAVCFHIERAGPQPVVVPVEVRKTR